MSLSLENLISFQTGFEVGLEVEKITLHLPAFPFCHCLV